MPNDNSKTVVAYEDFASLIEEASLELQKSYSFLLRANTNPILLFKESNIYLKSERNVITAVMNESYLKNKKVTSQAFQEFLASILDKAVQEWVKNKGIVVDVRVNVRNANSFPSNFALYVNKVELIQFNIFAKWYGVREQIPTTDKINEDFEKFRVSSMESIQQTEEKIVYWENIDKKTVSLIQNPRNIFTLLFKRKTLKGNVEKKIASLEYLKQDILRQIEYAEDGIPKQMEMYHEKQRNLDKLLPFFEELEYFLETERSKLY